MLHQCRKSEKLISVPQPKNISRCTKKMKPRNAMVELLLAAFASVSVISGVSLTGGCSSKEEPPANEESGTEPRGLEDKIWVEQDFKVTVTLSGDRPRGQSSEPDEKAESDRMVQELEKTLADKEGIMEVLVTDFYRGCNTRNFSLGNEKNYLLEVPHPGHFVEGKHTSEGHPSLHYATLFPPFDGTAGPTCHRIGDIAVATDLQGLGISHKDYILHKDSLRRPYKVTVKVEVYMQVEFDDTTGSAPERQWYEDPFFNPLRIQVKLEYNRRDGWVSPKVTKYAGTLKTPDNLLWAAMFREDLFEKVYGHYFPTEIAERIRNNDLWIPVKN